jgi:hypothetical protein
MHFWRVIGQSRMVAWLTKHAAFTESWSMNGLHRFNWHTDIKKQGERFDVVFFSHGFTGIPEIYRFALHSCLCSIDQIYQAAVVLVCVCCVYVCVLSLSLSCVVCICVCVYISGYVVYVCMLRVLYLSVCCKYFLSPALTFVVSYATHFNLWHAWQLFL